MSDEHASSPTDASDIAPVSEASAKRAKAAKPVQDPGTTADLTKAAYDALSNETTELTDNLGIAWRVTGDVVDNHSTVLMQGRKGSAEAHRNLNTRLLAVSAQPAADAIAAICADLA